MKKEKNQLRVLMTTDTVGGVWSYSLNLARALKTYGIEVHLASMGPLPDEQQRKEVAAISNVKLYESSYKLEWMSDPWDEIEQASMWLLYLEQEIRPHLVHLNNYIFGELPWDSPVIVVGHSCVMSWWEAVKKEEAPAHWKKYRDRVGHSLGSSDCVVAVSQHMMHSLQKYYGPLTNTRVIYNGINLPQSSRRKKENQIFAMGRSWDEGKNLQLLADISGQLANPTIIAGEYQEDQWKNRENLHMTGQLTRAEVEDLLNKSSVFVSPSLYEPFGLAALEAAGSTCALVLSDIDTYHEIWQDAALYFDPRSAESLQQTLEELMNNPGLVQRMGRKARKRAADFNIRQTAEAYHQLYQQLLNPLEKYDITDQSYAN